MNRQLDESGFRYGIEHEVAMITPDGQFSDFTNTSYDQLNQIIDKLPIHESDYPNLRVGDLGIKLKRWYIEGYERFSKDGDYLKTDIKGLEIRTPIADSIKEAVEFLKNDYARLANAAKEYKYRPITVSLNPFTQEFIPKPPLNPWEIAHRSSPEDQTSYIHMITYGPDVNISHTDLTVEEIIDIGKKLTYYSPFIVPFSYSSPFYAGKAWGGLSRRTFYRTGKRPAALVFLGKKSQLINSYPTLTDLARIPAEIGRVEFKAFDACPNLDLYGSLLVLIKGLILDTSLTERAIIPDANMHQKSSRVGLHDDYILDQAKQILSACEKALPSQDVFLLEPLKQQLIARSCVADHQLAYYNKNKDIIKTLEALS